MKRVIWFSAWSLFGLPWSNTFGHLSVLIDVQVNLTLTAKVKAEKKDLVDVQVSLSLGKCGEEGNNAYSSRIPHQSSCQIYTRDLVSDRAPEETLPERSNPRGPEKRGQIGHAVEFHGCVACRGFLTALDRVHNTVGPHNAKIHLITPSIWTISH